MSKEAAKKLLEEAIEALNAETEQGLIQAEAQFNHLLDRNRNVGELWFWAGVCQMRRGFLAAAEEMYRKSLELDPKAISTYNNLGYVLHKQLRDEEAMASFDKALEVIDGMGVEVNDSKAQLHNNIASVFSNNGTPERALEHSQKAIDLDDNDSYYWNRAFANLELGNWEQGFADYERGGFVPKSGHTSNEIRRKVKDYGGIPEWDGTPGKRVVVYGEQGIGDEIMFASIIPDAEKGCELIFDGHPRLQKIYQDAWPHLSIFGTRKGDKLPWVDYLKPEARIAIGSLAAMYRKKDEDFPRVPYLKPNEGLYQHYADKYDHLPSGPFVGLHWKGGYMKTRKDLRSVTLEQLLPIVQAFPEAQFFSFQYTEGAAEEVAEFNERHGTNIIHDQTAIDNYHHTAALVYTMDLVVSVNTSLVHLCGALGQRCITMTPYRHAWRYGRHGDPHMPFYGPHVEQVWQEESAIWEPVIEEVITRAASHLGRLPEAESAVA